MTEPAAKIADLTIEEKVGQMMGLAYVPRYYHRQNPDFERFVTLVSEGRVGGIMFYAGYPYEIALSIERLQEAARTPLLVMADIEWGLPQRVHQTTRFPQNMAVGATGREDYAYEIGAVTAKEAKSLGIHVGFAPVMDVNNNPDNIIINTRSYGEEPELVGRLGSAFIRGMQAHGLHATAKHFPGHGDTNVDSHMHLPEVNASCDRLERVELPPFQAAVTAGVKCVMMAHITYPQVPEMQGRPATLDSHFIRLLREQMRFDGLIMTDALDMGGITENYWSGEAAVMAINAGVDMLLIPPYFESTYAFVVNAVKSGRIPLERIDESVGRLLASKEELGLASTPILRSERMEDIVANPSHLAKAEEIADAAITLLRDRNNALPFRTEDLQNVLVLTITDEEGGVAASEVFTTEVRARVPKIVSATIDPRSSELEINEILQKAESADAILAGLFISWRTHKGGLSLPKTTSKQLEKLFDIERPIALVAFGSPYTLRQVPETPSFLCTYDASELAVRSAVRAVFGEIPITAKLPVSIPPFHKIGDGLDRAAQKMELVLDARKEIFEEAFQVVQAGVSKGLFPGAQLAIVCDGRLIVTQCFGKLTDNPDAPEVTPGTLFGLGCQTEVIATVPIAMHLWENKRILLDVPIRNYLPRFQGGARDSVTLRHLLTHTSGLPPLRHLPQIGEDEDLTVDYISTIPLEGSPGESTIYSGLGFLLVNAILETVTAMSFDRLMSRTILEPLKLSCTEFRRPAEHQGPVAPGSPRLHSYNGLCSTAQDLAAFAQMLLNGGVYRHHRLFSPATVNYWTGREGWSERGPWALGWQLASAGALFDERAFSATRFGHWQNGGASLLIDPKTRTSVILLLNQTNSTRDQSGIDRIRRELHNKIAEVFESQFSLEQ